MSVETFEVAGSSLIEQLEYDNDVDTLTVTFTDGRRYAYYNVEPSTYRSFTLAPSKGRFFISRIKGGYGYAEI